jgi:hypothetical protein
MRRVGNSPLLEYSQDLRLFDQPVREHRESTRDSQRVNQVFEQALTLLRDRPTPNLRPAVPRLRSVITT